MPFLATSLCLYNSTPYGTTPASSSPTVNWYSYATADAAATVLADGYFNNVRSKLKVNDVIQIMAVAGGTGDFLGVKVTAAPASGNVTVAVNSEASGS